MRKPTDGDAAAYALAAFLGFAGTTHFLNPGFYDPIVPHVLPLSPRTWTYVSGVAELAAAVAVANRRTRALGGVLAAGLFVARVRRQRADGVRLARPFRARAAPRVRPPPAAGSVGVVGATRRASGTHVAGEGRVGLAQARKRWNQPSISA